MNPILPGFAGVDEAGRGPWAGPVVVAAVLLDPARPIVGVGDSKALTEKRRLALYPQIQEQAIAWNIQFVSAQDIDLHNILQATFMGMCRSVAALNTPLTGALIDGNRVPPGLVVAGRAIIKGDATEPAIAAASVLAKVARDLYLEEMEDKFPGYGFSSHKGYGTAAHAAALQRLGPCSEHRRTYAPVAKVIAALAGR